MIDKIKKNKIIIIFFSILFLALVYCSFQIFIISDDLPYSLLHRGSERVGSIRDIISNQLADYKYTNARIFIHSVVQFLLMFGKNLWAILNPIMIIMSICLSTYIIYIISNRKKINKIFLIMINTCFFLLLYNYKYLVYWVAGSVNYVWLYVLMLLFIIYDLRIGLENKKITSLICLAGSILHESFAIFIIIYIISKIILFKILKRKVNYKRLVICLLFSLVGFCFIMFAPSTINRMNSNGEWNKLNIIEKFIKAIPVISYKAFYLFDIYNLIPIIFMISIIYNLFLNRFKYSKYINIGLMIISLLMIFINNGWLCLVLAIMLLLSQIYILIKNKDYKLIAIILGGYAVIYSLFLTTEYVALRTNYYFNLIVSIFIIYNYFSCKINELINKILKVLVVVVTFSLVFIEVHIYQYIGNVMNNRIEEITNTINSDDKLVQLKKIREPYAKFHIDANSPSGNDYWAYQYFLDYYGLDDDVDTVLVP